MNKFFKWINGNLVGEYDLLIKEINQDGKTYLLLKSGNLISKDEQNNFLQEVNYYDIPTKYLNNIFDYDLEIVDIDNNENNNINKNNNEINKNDNKNINKNNNISIENEKFIEKLITSSKYKEYILNIKFNINLPDKNFFNQFNEDFLTKNKEIIKSKLINFIFESNKNLFYNKIEEILKKIYKIE